MSFLPQIARSASFFLTFCQNNNVLETKKLLLSSYFALFLHDPTETFGTLGTFGDIRGHSGHSGTFGTFGDITSVYHCTHGEWNTYSVEVLKNGSTAVSFLAKINEKTVMQGSYNITGAMSNGVLNAYVSDGHADAAFDYHVRNFFFAYTALRADTCYEVFNCFNIVNSSAIAPAQNNLLATGPAALGYKASAEVFCDHSPPTYSGYTSVLRLGGGPDYGAPGDRTFLLMRVPSFNNIHFVINHPDNIQTWAHQIYTDITCTDGEWSTYTVEVTDAGNGQINYVASVDGSIVMSGSYAASGSKSTGNLTAYVADNYQDGAASAYRVRNFFYQIL